MARNDAVADNGAALHHASGAQTVIRNSIVGRNSPINCSGTTLDMFTAEAVNLDTDASCSGFTLQEATPLFDSSLADNGGPTETLALQAESDAINAAEVCPTPNIEPNVDQRGVERPQGSACDLGAFEVEAPDGTDEPDLTATKANDAGGSANVGSTFQWRITVSNEGDASATFDEATGTDPDEINSPRFLTDVLPSGADYGSLTVDDSGVASGSAHCEKQVFDGVTLIRCAADGSITFDPGDAFTVAINVTPTETGDLVNPLELEDAICAADP